MNGYTIIFYKINIKSRPVHFLCFIQCNKLLFILFDIYIPWHNFSEFIETCGSDILATTNPQQISSPGYPGYYYSNRDCEWIIRPSTPGSLIHLEFIEFRTQNQKDFVSVSLMWLEIVKCVLGSKLNSRINFLLRIPYTDVRLGSFSFIEVGFSLTFWR